MEQLSKDDDVAWSGNLNWLLHTSTDELISRVWDEQVLTETYFASIVISIQNPSPPSFKIYWA